jgi:hypothetical protein
VRFLLLVDPAQYGSPGWGLRLCRVAGKTSIGRESVASTVTFFMGAMRRYCMAKPICPPFKSASRESSKKVLCKCHI